MGLLSIPSVSEAIRAHLPPWGLALVVIGVSILVIFFFEKYIYIAVTSLVGALATAMGADMILKTGFDQEAIRCLTSPDPPKDFQVRFRFIRVVSFCIVSCGSRRCLQSHVHTTMMMDHTHALNHNHDHHNPSRARPRCAPSCTSSWASWSLALSPNSASRGGRGARRRGGGSGRSGTWRGASSSGKAMGRRRGCMTEGWGGVVKAV